MAHQPRQHIWTEVDSRTASSVCYTLMSSVSCNIGTVLVTWPLVEQRHWQKSCLCSYRCTNWWRGDSDNATSHRQHPKKVISTSRVLDRNISTQRKFFIKTEVVAWGWSRWGTRKNLGSPRAVPTFQWETLHFKDRALPKLKLGREKIISTHEIVKNAIVAIILLLWRTLFSMCIISLSWTSEQLDIDDADHGATAKWWHCTAQPPEYFQVVYSPHSVLRLFLKYVKNQNKRRSQSCDTFRDDNSRTLLIATEYLEK